jgi:hypothetical protein
MVLHQDLAWLSSVLKHVWKGDTANFERGSIATFRGALNWGLARLSRLILRLMHDHNICLPQLRGLVCIGFFCSNWSLQSCRAYYITCCSYITLDLHPYLRAWFGPRSRYKCRGRLISESVSSIQVCIALMLVAQVSNGLCPWVRCWNCYIYLSRRRPILFQSDPLSKILWIGHPVPIIRLIKYVLSISMIFIHPISLFFNSYFIFLRPPPYASALPVLLPFDPLLSSNNVPNVIRL